MAEDIERKVRMFEQREKILIATLGDGDCSVVGVRRPDDTQPVTGICVHPSPNGIEPIGTLHPELVGEHLECIDDTAIIIYFRTAFDVDKFIADVQSVRDAFKS